MRVKILLLILLITAGIGTKYYQGPASDFMHHYAGGFIYVVFFIVLASLLLRRTPPEKLAVLIFLATSLIECSQLIQAPSLNALRQYFIVVALIGNTFVWWDFLAYLAGAIAGYWLIKRIDRITIRLIGNCA